MSIHGLTASPEHNGMQGKLETFDSDKGRWGVRLKSNGKLLGLKPANLSLVQVLCRGSTHMPCHTGQVPSSCHAS